MKTMMTISIFLLLILSVVSCDKQDTTPPGLQDLPEKSAQLVSSDNQFGLELFKKVAAKADLNSNTTVSPLSVSLALAMTYNGANGQTKTDMEKTLKLYGLTTEQINVAHKALVEALKSDDPEVVLEIANAIFYKKELAVKSDFVTLNKDFYNAPVTPLDFTNTVQTLATINGWVNTKTHEKIPTIIDQVEADLVMVLLNAIYFNGIWTNKFDEKGTHMQPFRHEDGTSKDVAQMSQENSFEYASNDLFSAVNLPYGKGNFQMTVLLPNNGKSTGDIISQLSNEKWEGWMKSFTKKDHVVVTMPRFKFSWQMKLNEVLSDMGMGTAFSPTQADFSGISDADLYIGFVIHKTYIDVNEKGTEAAAVTAVGMDTTSIPVDPKTYFRVDRPFLFAITEKTTGAILFIGEVNGPVY